MPTRRDFVRAGGAGIVAGFMKSLRGGDTPPPNIMVMLADDMGYGDLSPYTPNLNRLATNGTRFTQCDTVCSVCTPSRAALSTARYPLAMNSVAVLDAMDQKTQGGIPVNEITTAQYLEEVGYDTYHIGKWHLGNTEPFWPTARGSKEFYGTPLSVDETPVNLVSTADGTVKDVTDQRSMLTPWLRDRAISAIKRSVQSKKPFLINLWFTAPHWPYNPPSYVQDIPVSPYLQELIAMDMAVGDVMNALADSGVFNNTLVVFLSDNGPALGGGSTGGLNGGKAGNNEGGYRVPCILHGPGIVPSGWVNDAVISEMDIPATILDLLGIPPRRIMYGQSLMPILRKQKQQLNRQLLLYSHYAAWVAVRGWYGASVNRRSVVSSAPLQDYKLICCDNNGNELVQKLLFNSGSDPYEQNPLNIPEVEEYFLHKRETLALAIARDASSS